MISNFDNFINENKYYNKELSPVFWKDDKLNENVKKKLLKISYDFYADVKLDNDVKDIILTGSLANYTYNKYSDLDVHIVIDLSDDKVPEETIDYINSKKYIWNIKHNITIRTHSVELYIQDKNEKHESTGIYSLLNDEWIVKPKYNEKEVDEDTINLKYNQFIYDIFELEKYTDLDDLSDENIEDCYEKAKELKDKIIKYRKAGLAKDGELSVENLVYKKLRQHDKIDRIFEIIDIFYDKKFIE